MSQVLAHPIPRRNRSVTRKYAKPEPIQRAQSPLCSIGPSQRLDGLSRCGSRDALRDRLWRRRLHLPHPLRHGENAPRHDDDASANGLVREGELGYARPRWLTRANVECGQSPGGTA